MTFNSIDAVAYGNAHFGAGVGLIYLNNVDCTGAETGLLQCSYTSGSSCTYAHSEDAGVRCQGKRSSCNHFYIHALFIKHCVMYRSSMLLQEELYITQCSSKR